MKNILLCLMVLASFVKTSAQTNSKFFADTCYWYVYEMFYTGPFSPNFNYEYQKVEGDTLYNNRIYQKIYRKTFSSNQSPINAINFNFYGYYLYDSGRVYRGINLDTMGIEYDFNLAPGDSFLFNCYYQNSSAPADHYLHVNVVDSVLYNSVWRKRIIFEPTNNTSGIGGNISLQWIEGIGTQYGPIDPYSAIQFLTKHGNIGLVCFSENFQPVIGTCSFVGFDEYLKKETKLLISPQPATKELYLQSTQVLFKQEEELVLCDINGKQIKVPVMFINVNTYKLDISGLNAGMYFACIKTSEGVLRKKVLVE